jgi:competence transcription factor ComK
MGTSIKQEFIRQYNHAFKVFIAIVEKFDKYSWSYTGRKNYTPDRLSYHILHSIKYYLEDTSILHLKSGKTSKLIGKRHRRKNFYHKSK